MGIRKKIVLNADGVLELTELMEELKEQFNSSKPPTIQENEVTAAFRATLLFVNNVCKDLRRRNMLTSIEWIRLCDREIAAAGESPAVDRLVRRAITPDFIQSLFDAVAIEKRLNAGMSGHER